MAMFRQCAADAVPPIMRHIRGARARRGYSILILPFRELRSGTLRSEKSLPSPFLPPWTVHNMTDERIRNDGGLGPLTAPANAVMPGQGRSHRARSYTSCRTCRHSTTHSPTVIGHTTFDVYLNNRAYWRNVPSNVWAYKLGGYQVLKKWLSYREHNILQRALLADDVQHFTNTARRIGAILLECSNQVSRSRQ